MRGCYVFLAVPLLFTQRICTPPSAQHPMPNLLQGAKGGLDSSDGWLGFSLAILTMLATVVNFVCLQASRGFNFTSIFLLVSTPACCGSAGVHNSGCQMRRGLLHCQSPNSSAPLPLTTMQHCYLPLTITLLLPLSLGIDGADWSGQFSHWDAGAVVLLVCAATIVYLGGNFLLQNATWQLGAPMGESSAQRRPEQEIKETRKKKKLNCRLHIEHSSRAPPSALPQCRSSTASVWLPPLWSKKLCCRPPSSAAGCRLRAWCSAWPLCRHTWQHS